MSIMVMTHLKNKIMRNYIIRYIDKSGDSCSIWITANSVEEAKREAKREYWDIEEIISCREK